MITFSAVHSQRLQHRVLGCAVAAVAAVAGATLGAPSAGGARPAGRFTHGSAALVAWRVCGYRAQRSGTEIAQVQAARMSCVQAAAALRRGRVLLTPAGPVFSDGAFACRWHNLEPVTPAPSQLPELVRCTGSQHRVVRFIWTWS